MRVQLGARQETRSYSLVGLPDGTALASSVLPMSEMVRVFRELAGCPLWQAVRMASLTPATIVGRQDEIGSLVPGKLADVVLIDTPPMLLASDAAHLMGGVDSVLVVARAGKTTAEQAERVRDLLNRLDAPVAGLALNEAREIPLPRGRWLLPAQWQARARRVLRRA